MERELNVLNSLIDFLISHGYPKESLVVEWKVGNNLYVDLAVIDPISNNVVAIFEIKRRKTVETLNLAKQQLIKYKTAMGEQKVPAYIVFYNGNNNPPFDMYYIKPQESDEVEEIVEVPSYSIFKNAVLQKTILETKEKRKSTLTSFQIVCWIMALFIFILLIMDLSDVIKLSAERLTMLGATVGLIIIPFASKLKILGMEFERLTDEK